MGAGGLGFGAVWVAVILAAPASAQESGGESASVPVSAPVPASESVPASVPESAPASVSAPASARDGARLAAAVRRGLEAHGYHASLSQELVGRAVVACQTPECIEQSLDAAGAAFAIVPAIWLRKSSGEEVTLTLVQRSGRSLNATGVVGDDLAGATVGLVEGLLARRAEAVAAAATESATGIGTETGTGTGTGTGGERGRPHAWKAGPIILIAGGSSILRRLRPGLPLGRRRSVEASPGGWWVRSVGAGVATRGAQLPPGSPCTPRRLT